MMNVRTTLDSLATEMRMQRDLFEARMAAAEQALTVAMSTNDTRLEGMNEFREALNDTINRMLTRSEGLASIHAVDTRSSSELGALREKVEAGARPNWVLLTSFLSAFFVVVAGLWLVVGLKMEATVAPALTQLAGLGAKFEAQSSNLATLVERVVTLRSDTSVQRAALVEIETQFCASDTVRNLMHASDMRIEAILWHKSFPDQTLPTDNAYYPIVCNRVSSAK